MFTRREERHLRVPSPVPIIRTIRQGRGATGLCDDHYMDPRIKPRDPSPGGLGRLSTSAPGEDTFYWGRRYREQRPYSADYVGNASYYTSGYGRSRDHRPFSDHLESAGYVTSGYGGFGRTRDPSPRNAARVMSSSVPSSYVNGDVMSYRGGGRPKSFPDQRGAYLYESPVQTVYGHEPRQRESSMEHRYKGQGSSAHSTGSSTQSASSSAQSAGSAAPSAGETSPGSDEAMSSVTLTADRAMAEGEGEYTHDDGVHALLLSLSCYLCGQLYRRPRILPCGHTFCSECLAQLKEETIREGRHVTGAPCTTEGRHRPEVGVQFVCPMPECRYTMRLMNLGRWSTRNKAVSDAVSAVRITFENKQDATTQTDITMDSMLVTIPRSLLHETPPSGGDRSLMRRNSSSLMDRMVHRALSMDSLNNTYYIPRQHVTWRSYVAMLGMHILQQVIHT